MPKQARTECAVLLRDVAGFISINDRSRASPLDKSLVHRHMTVERSSRAHRAIIPHHGGFNYIAVFQIDNERDHRAVVREVHAIDDTVRLEENRTMFQFA